MCQDKISSATAELSYFDHMSRLEFLWLPALNPADTILIAIFYLPILPLKD